MTLTRSAFVFALGRVVGLVLALGLALLVTPAHADGRLTFDPETIYKVPRGEAPADGPVDAPVTIVYWSDYACGYCYRVQPTLDTLTRMFPGQLRWVHRTLPLDDDETIGAEAALAAAAQGQFRPMNDRLYALAGHVDRPAVELIARELGLDMVRFRGELDARTHREQLASDITDAHALGVSGTPTFFLNGRPVHGNQPLKVFVDVVEQELARAGSTKGGYDQLVATGKLAADAPAETEHVGFELDPKATYRVGLGLPGHQLGPDSAAVTIVVWSDFQCPFCQRSAPVVTQLREKYGDDVRVVFRHLAMQFHKNAGLAAEAAIAAADQGKFWAFHDQVWAHFGQLTRADLESFAQAAGLDLGAFRAALDQRRYRDLVVAEGATALALGVDGTPTMFVNGQPVVGARDFATMDTIVAAHLTRAKQAIAAGVPSGDIYALLMSDALGVERADPSRVPDPSVAKVALRAEDRARAISAACRRRDAKRAIELATGLAAEPRRRAALVCAASGIDL
ncbi:MAG: thioredoxin domain-containing protein [Myxococcales bacterium]|nr:thioredoxin domain-containing protein [Myxococcales bacterium]